MVWMVVELHFLVCVGILEVAGLGACKGTSLSRLHRTVVAAEALAVHVVVVVLTIVGYIERGIIVPDDLLLAGILALVVHRHGISLAAGIRNPARIRAVGVEATQLRYDALAADVDVLGVASALVGYKIGRHIQRELCCVRTSSGKHRIDIDLLALTAGLHRALAVGIIPVVGHESIVVR